MDGRKRHWRRRMRRKMPGQKIKPPPTVLERRRKQIIQPLCSRASAAASWLECNGNDDEKPRGIGIGRLLWFFRFCYMSHSTRIGDGPVGLAGTAGEARRTRPCCPLCSQPPGQIWSPEVALRSKPFWHCPACFAQSSITCRKTF